MFDTSSESEGSDLEESVLTHEPAPQPKITGVKHMADIRNMLELEKYQKKKLKKIRKRKESKARKLGLDGSSKIIQTLATKLNGVGPVPEQVTYVDHKNRNGKANSKDLEIKPNSEQGVGEKKKRSYYETGKI